MTTACTNCLTQPPLETLVIMISDNYRRGESNNSLYFNRENSPKLLSGEQLDNSTKRPGQRGRPRGTPQSEHAKERIRQARLGRSHSQAARDKISLSRSGRRSSQPPVPEIIRHWAQFLWFALRREFRRGWRRRWDGKLPRTPPNIGRQTINDLAQRIALVGPTTDREAQHVFHAMVALLFTRERLDSRKGLSLKKYVELLPNDREKILRIVEAVKATAPIPGPGIAKAVLSVEEFIEVSLEMPRPRRVAERYVDYLLNAPERRERTIRSIFCRRTFEYWKPRLRGLFSELASPEFYEQLLRIKTVR